MVDEVREDQGPDHVGPIDHSEGFDFYSEGCGGQWRVWGREKMISLIFEGNYSGCCVENR